MRKRLAMAALVLMLLPAVPARAADPGDGIVIAVLDTGVDSSHPELKDRVERMSFYRSPIPPVPGLPDPTTLQPDPDGHGTAAASVAAAKSFGVASGARILDMQVSARYTQGALDPTAEEAATRAMDELLRHHGGNGTAGPRVVLLSFANNLTASGAATLAAQAHDLWDAGVLVIVPAGSHSPLHDSPYVVTVGDRDATCAAGVPAAGVLKPDLAAAARNVKVATPGTPTGGQGQASGTAFASASVAGAAALMWQARPGLPVAALAAIMRDTAADKAAAGPDGCTGFGALDAEAAVVAAKAWSDPVPPGTPSAAKSPMPIGPLVALVLLALAARRR
ncbi:MAG: S8 family serine peptidase [bacterium]